MLKKIRTTALPQSITESKYYFVVPLERIYNYESACFVYVENEIFASAHSHFSSFFHCTFFCFVSQRILKELLEK
jgi:hypothetical protein